MNRAAYYNEIDPFAAQWIRNLIKAGLVAPGDVDERSVVDVQPDDLRGYTQCHFFAGIGVWSHALRLAGWSDDRPVWTGSCPCQPFSIAGAGKGTDDPRHLWPVWFDLIRQCRPATVFGEQVEAAIKHGWLDLVQGDLENAGYACGAVCLPAGAVGAPHQRQRLWFVANAHTPSKGMGRAADSPISGRSSRNARPGSGCSGTTGSLANADSQPDEQSFAGRFLAPQGAEAGRSDHRVVHSGAVGSMWDTADWIYCRDHKYRSVEPGTFPLVDGSAFKLGSGCTDWEGKSRAGMLKAYGNAIVPQVAATVISAFMEYAP